MFTGRCVRWKRKMSHETRSAAGGAGKQSAKLPVSGVTMIKVMASDRTNKKPEILTKEQ